MTKLNKRLLVGVITLMLLITSLFGFYFFTNDKTVSADSTAIDKQSTLFEPYAAEESNSERFVLNGNVLVKYNGTEKNRGFLPFFRVMRLSFLFESPCFNSCFPLGGRFPC